MKHWTNESPHLAKSYDLWLRVQELKRSGCFELDGKSLHVAHVISVADHECHPQLTTRSDVLEGLYASVNVLTDHLAEGHYIYGTNTGFGGSADTRTNELVPLQAALMQLTQAGILSPSINDAIPEQAMPASWVRATIAVRCNATVRGHTAVSLSILEALLRLLEHGITPIVPLRGSVSASGDLMPLSYIAGLIEGNPDVLAIDKHGRVLPAAHALKVSGIMPVTLGPKEGLGLINGTASSAALGTLVVGHAHGLAVLSQVLTAIAVEALRGSVESFHPFIARVRPHPGQVECARNISRFLHGSHLARDVHRSKSYPHDDLEQDRYSLRSAPQWLGPQVEDLLSADRQISTELNSSCDNPLIDTATGDIMYGCNFQAASVSSAMEKIRLGLQMMGRLLFAQLTELADPNLNGGLPASLAADNPSLSFTIKGVEISMASYMAELSYLAAPMTPHVQPAEMHNQSINSMALASARMSWQAVDILSMMCACSVYAGCQALDLRALHTAFKDKAVGAILVVTSRLFASSMTTADYTMMQGTLEAQLRASWDKSAKRDLHDRCCQITDDAIPTVLRHVGDVPTATVLAWKRQCDERALAAWELTFAAFCAAPHTSELLGRGSKRLYRFVREELGVPFHQGLVEHPIIGNVELDGRAKKTIGGWVSKVYDAIRNGAIYDSLMKLVEEEEEEEEEEDNQ